MVINDSPLNKCPKWDFSSQKCQLMIYMRILYLVIEKSITKIEEIAKNLFWPTLVCPDRSFPGTIPGTVDRDPHSLAMTENCRPNPDRDPQLLGNPWWFTVRPKSRPGNLGRYRECSVTTWSLPRPPDPAPITGDQVISGHHRPPATAAGHWRPPQLTTVDHHRPPQTAAAGNFSGQLRRPT